VVNADAVVVGGGAIGLSIAWRAAQAGLAVTVVDPQPGAGATRAAAGMLAPVSEAHYGEEALLALNLASADAWPAFAAEIEEASGAGIGFGGEGSLVVAFDADDHAALERLYKFHCQLGLAVERLRSRDVRAVEPMVHPAARSGLLALGERRVDPRALVAALAVAAQRAGVGIVCDRVARVRLDAGERVTGVSTVTGADIDAGTVVLAAGCWSASVDGLPPDACPPVRPVKGQILTLAGTADAPPIVGRAVRGLVKGASVYLVPRGDGRVVVGATVEERGWDTTVTAGAVYELLRDAAQLVPGTSELELAEATAGLRPGSPDNAPLIGPGALPGLAVATGHFRNGILLTPVTAAAVADLLSTGEVPSVVEPFDPRRFAPAVAEPVR
jgi:glycine oxidase